MTLKDNEDEIQISLKWIEHFLFLRHTLLYSIYIYIVTLPNNSMGPELSSGDLEGLDDIPFMFPMNTCYWHCHGP